MSSKAFIFLGLLFAIVVLLSSEVSARDLVTATTEEAVGETNGVEDELRRHFGGHHHHHHHHHHHRRRRHHCFRPGCTAADEVADEEPQEKPQN